MPARIHAEKPKVPGARRGRPPKAQTIMGKDLVAAPPMVPGVDPKVSLQSSSPPLPLISSADPTLGACAVCGEN
jgi:hypothetical protein